ncbi:unnamed protein product [Moneuplotes crassus]|uniref:EF-hand domain-containing protein n=1 Tax=Euplotes crassus TaxID=5936 RepID=A0AAD2DAL5_EUPCR|nr:unnamed protein product [Moneuplotes crassus]
MDDTPCFNKKLYLHSSRKNGNPDGTKARAIKTARNKTDGKLNQMNCFTDDETICATVVPHSGRDEHKEDTINDFRTDMDTSQPGGNLNLLQREEDTHSEFSAPVKAELSNLIPEARSTQRFGSNLQDLQSARFSAQEIEESKSIVEKFLSKKKDTKKKKANPKPQVFSRLHNQAVVKQKKKAEIELKHSKSLKKKNLKHSKSTYINEDKLYTLDSTPKKSKKYGRNNTKGDLAYDACAGHSLYLKSRGKSRKKEHSIKRIKRRRSMKQKKVQDELTKVPLMSNKSKWILKSKNLDSTFKDETLLTAGADQQRLIERTKQEYIQEKNKKYNFEPHITKKSKELAKNYHTDQKLANDALSREKEVLEQKREILREKSLSKECSFKPEIGELNRKLALNKENTQQFLKRLTTSKSMTEKNIEEKREEIRYLQEVYDADNNQQFFHPKISQYEKLEELDRKNKGYENIHEALYKEAKIFKDKKKNLKKSYKKQEKLESQNYRVQKMNKNSKKILSKTHTNKLVKIFEALDSDEDGYISAQKIELSNLSNKILDVITPLLLKIEEHELNINFEQFANIVLEFAQSLSVTDRNTILGPEREPLKCPPEQPTFAPELSANTRAINELGEERNFKLWEDHRNRGEGENQKENEELQHCTFHPKIRDYRPERFKMGMNTKDEIKEVLSNLISHD